MKTVAGLEKRLIVRADGNLKMGYGHIIRSLALLSQLTDKYSCLFAIRNPDEFIQKQILSFKIRLVTLESSLNEAEELHYLTNKVIQKDDIVLLDGYHYSTSYQQKIREACFKLICIDDIHEQHFVADAIINHGEGISKTQYSSEFYTRFYLGASYALLRKPFLKAAGLIKTLEGRNSVFINLGGTDHKNYTVKALKFCLKNTKYKNIDILIGSIYPFRKQLEDIIGQNSNRNIKLYSDLDATKICALMQKSAIGICASSTIAYEYSCAGGFLLLYKTADNQKLLYKFLIQNGLAFAPAIFSKDKAAFEKKSKQNNFFKNRAQYFDSNSSARLKEIFSKLELYRNVVARKATAGDMMLYYKWANDPEVRKSAIHKEAIPLENHKKWFASRLSDIGSFLYLLEKQSKPLGQVRFEMKQGRVEIDYSIAAAYRGKGYGEIILSKAIECFKLENANKALSLNALVKTGNIPSNKVFEKLNFKKGKTVVIKKEKYNSYLLAL